MSETIDWRSLQPVQRDEMIHEKVMGHSRVTGPRTCGTRNGGTMTYRVTSWQTGGPDVPHYTTSLDAAWLVVHKMNEPIDGGYDLYAKFIDELTAIVGSDLFFDLFYCDPESDDRHLTGERICIAALRACGYTVVSEGK